MSLASNPTMAASNTSNAALAGTNANASSGAANNTINNGNASASTILSDSASPQPIDPANNSANSQTAANGAAASSGVLSAATAGSRATGPTADAVTGLSGTSHKAFGFTKAIEDALNAEREELLEKARSPQGANTTGLPVRAYLDQTVVPVLLEGLKALVRERPPNPTEYLAVYLLKNGNR